MKEVFLNRSISFITSYKKYSLEEIEKLRYGLEGIYLTIYKLVIILILSLILRTFKETIILLLLFNIIRFPAFGFHASTSRECLIVSLLFLLGIPYLLLHIDIPFYLKVSICCVCLICFLIYAPADTVKRPLPNKRKRIIRKSFSVLLCFIYMLGMFLFKNKTINNLFFAAILIETILILPVTYKLFHQPYGNYKTIKKV